MKNPHLLDIYSDFLLASFNLVTATGLSRMLDNGYSHDQISRFLAQRKFTQKDFWKMVKPIIRKIESEDAILAIDDTIEEKPHSTENDIICWHWDHSKNSNVKGINILNFLYQSSLEDGQDICIPTAFEVIEKTEQYHDVKSGKVKRRSSISKNELLRNRLRTLVQLNRLKFKYVVWDTWFSAKENFEFVHYTLKKYFIGALKSNRTIALSKQDKLQGKFVKVQQLDLQPNRTYKVWLKGVDFELLLVKQVFINQDGSSGELYLVSNDLSLSDDACTTIYNKRWKVEVFHKSLKQNAGLEKSPTKYEVTQSNHIFAAMIAYCKMELLKIKENSNHFALKSRLYLKAVKAAFNELQYLKQYQIKIEQQQSTPLLG
ncbi:MAG: transposase [Bacteroidota bacterium]